jgi:hypothetical protein
MEQQSQSRRLGMSLFAMLASMEASGVFEVSTSAASARSPSTKPTESASTHTHTPTAAATCRVSESSALHPQARDPRRCAQVSRRGASGA